MLPLLAALPLLQDAPAGFVPTDERNVRERGSRGGDAPGWMVTLVGDRLRVETRVAWVARERREAVVRKPRTGGYTIPNQMAKTTWHPGDGVKVADGWLFGFDAGEFGGGLYWFSADGKRRQKISDDNTPLVVATSKGVYAVQALAHMMFWYARLVRLESGPKGWQTRLVTDLHVSPREVIRDGDRFLLGTDDYVSTLETDGAQREIYRARFFYQGDRLCESMVRRANGEVWVGASRGVLRLRPEPGGEYAAQWFLPARR